MIQTLEEIWWFNWIALWWRIVWFSSLGQYIAIQSLPDSTDRAAKFRFVSVRTKLGLEATTFWSTSFRSCFVHHLHSAWPCAFMCYNAATSIKTSLQLQQWPLIAGQRWHEISPTHDNTRASNRLRSLDQVEAILANHNKHQKTIKHIKNFWVLHVNHFQSAIRQMAHGLGQALHSSRRAAEDVPPCPGRANGVISAGDPGSPPRLLAAVGRPLVNDLQLFCSCLQIQMCPNVSKWVKVKINLRAAGHAGIPPTPLQVELHWNYHSAPHDLHSEAPNLRQKSLAKDKQLLFSQW